MELKDKILFFIISLLPVYVMIIILKIDIKIPNKKNIIQIIIQLVVSNYLVTTLIILIIVSFVFLYIFSKRFSETKSSDFTYKVLEIKDGNSDFLSFFATYLIPFFTFQVEGIKSLILFLFTFIIMGVLYVKSNLYYNNIVLVLFGYNLLYVTLENVDNHKKIKGIILVKGKKNIPNVQNLIETEKMSKSNELTQIYYVKKKLRGESNE